MFFFFFFFEQDAVDFIKQSLQGEETIEAGEIKLNPLYRFREINEENGRIRGQWEKVGSLMHTEKLLASGKA